MSESVGPIEYEFTELRWEGFRQPKLESVSVLARYLLVRGNCLRVCTEQASEDLPVVSAWLDDMGRRITRYELPLPSLADGEHDLRRFREPSSVRVFMEDGSSQLVAPPVASTCVSLPLLRQAELLIGSQVELACSACCSEAVGGSLQLTRAGATALVSMRQLLRIWEDTASAADAGMALIVRLAGSLSSSLVQVCGSPRMGLRRERRLKPLAQVQDVDSACLRWLVRQPGESVAEKAGERQRAMAVVRVGDVDTQENRLVRDLLRRLDEECRKYSRDFGEFSRSERLRSVQRFHAKVRRLRIDSPVSSAGLLVGGPVPNYVLIYDRLYRELWEAYMQLYRQQTLQEKVWAWQLRTFVEASLLLVMHGMSAICSDYGAGGEVGLRSEQIYGSFFDTQVSCGGWYSASHHARIDLVRATEFRQYFGECDAFSEFAPDFVLVKRNRFVIFWTVSDYQGNTVKRVAAIERLSDALAFKGIRNAAYVVLQPMFDCADGGANDRSVIGCIEFWRLSAPLRAHSQAVQVWLGELLDLKVEAS